MNRALAIIFLILLIAGILSFSCHNSNQVTYTAPPPRTQSLDSATAGAGRPVWHEPPDTFTLNFRVTDSLPCPVKIELYNSGRNLVRTLADSTYAPGAYTITWRTREKDGSPIPYGIYYYQLDICGELSTRKITYRREKY